MILKYGIIIRVIIMDKYDVVVIGGGASGISCALAYKKQNPQGKIVILEQNERIGKKILKTGNGKCNLGNIHIGEKSYYNWDYIKQNMDSFVGNDYFKDLGIITRQDDQGRMYPYSETAASVVDILRSELARLKVELRCSFKVIDILKKDNFIIKGIQDSIEAVKVVMATGSLSQEKTNGYQLLEKLGHRILPLTPILVPIKVQGNIKSLQGLRVKCIAQANGWQEYGEILFKEVGLSGILALNLSRHVSKRDIITLDLVPDLSCLELEKLIESISDRDVTMILRGLLPKMLILDILKIAKTPQEIAQKIKKYCLKVEDLYGFEASQVTRGGVAMGEVTNNYASKIVPNLYVIGEVLDVDGECGGYNLMFAWMSGNTVGLII